MSIGGMMRTSVSGMAAQSNRLGAVAGNVANASTVGYKSVHADFSSLLLDAPSNTYLSGGVQTSMRYDISRQGVLERSASQYDLAISGNGFFLVEDDAGNVSLTRAGAFVPDGEGQLVNAAGYRLLGLPASGGAGGSVPVNGTAGLVPVDLIGAGMEAMATATGLLSVNLPSSAASVATAQLPSANLAASQSSARSSIVVYDNLGEDLTLDLHYARTTTPGQWELSVFDAAGRSSSGGVPYASGPLVTTILSFDAMGKLDPPAASLSIPVPGGATMALALDGTTQLASDFAVISVETDGNPPASSTSIEVSTEGVVYRMYPDGSRHAVFQIPLATVSSPDNLVPKSGNIFELSSGSGEMLIGIPGTGSLGSVVSGALESSTVDLASELTDMVEAQRNYTANSRVFQTGSELMEVLVNLKR